MMVGWMVVRCVKKRKTYPIAKGVDHDIELGTLENQFEKNVIPIGHHVEQESRMLNERTLSMQFQQSAIMVESSDFH